MTIPLLPQELIELIVDIIGTGEHFVTKDHRRTLYACSLTSWSFLVPSRRQLFGSVHIIQRGEPGSRPPKASSINSNTVLRNKACLDDLLQILQADPSHGRPNYPLLSSQIKSFIIKPYVPTNGLALSVSSSTLQERHQYYWSCQNSSLPTILRMLSCLETFGLKFPTIYNYVWSYLDDELVSALGILCSQPSLTSLHLRSITGLPSSFITGCSQLTSLFLHYIQDVEFAPLNAFDQSKSIHLKNLNIKDLNSPWDKYISRDFEHIPQLFTSLFASVDTLGIHFSLYEEVAVGWKLILSLSPTLINLELHHCFPFIDLDDLDVEERPIITVDISRMTNLRSLKWSSTFDGFLSTEIGLPTAIFELLQAISGPTTIETLIIDVEWSESNRDTATIVLTDSWPAFDALLTGTKFPALRIVVLHIHYWCDRGMVNPLPKVRADIVRRFVERMCQALLFSETIDFKVDIQAELC